MTVRTRMAPSPTGELHAGGMATVLKNYAYAKKKGGQFILRIEDTDQQRLIPGAVDEILKVIHDYGLDWDEGPDKVGPFGPYIQSQRLDLYQQHAQQLVKAGQAYYCFCSPERLISLRQQQQANHQPPRYDQHCLHLSPDEIRSKLERGEKYVIRLKVPNNQEVSFTDLIRGNITFNSSQVDDQVLLKSDGYPTYHLAVVVDDHLMQISMVMRGEEWISSTPKHVLLYQAFGWDMPVFAHVPVFLNPDGKGKMSKRKGTVSARSFLDRGYLPEAMLNFFMILGWSPQDQREILSLEEYVQEFDPADLNPNSVVFDLKKLDWLNGVYIRNLSPQELKKRLQPYMPADFPDERFDQILPLISERLVTLADFEQLTQYFYRNPQPSKQLLLNKADESLVIAQLQEAIAQLEQVTAWNEQTIELTLRKVQEIHNWQKNQFFMMLRLAVTGEKFTPPLFATMAVFEKSELLRRLHQAKQLVLS